MAPRSTMTRLPLPALIPLLALVACDGASDDDSGPRDSAPVVEGDTDADTDADSDADSDADTDADTDPDRWVALVRTSSSGVAYIAASLEEDGWVVHTIEAQDLNDELDARYRLMIYPGSADPIYDLLQDSTLDDTIRAFVGGGGGFIGICGGALLGGTTMVFDHGVTMGTVGLLDATAQQRSDWYAFYAGNTERFDWEVVRSHQILPMLAEGDTTEITYAGGPSFETDQEDLVLLRYTQDLDPSLTDHQRTGQAALLAGSYLEGRVILSSPHPEYSRQDLLQHWASWVAR